jgi:hypothetical protein
MQSEIRKFSSGKSKLKIFPFPDLAEALYHLQASHLLHILAANSYFSRHQVSTNHWCKSTSCEFLGGIRLAFEYLITMNALYRWCSTPASAFG